MRPSRRSPESKGPFAYLTRTGRMKNLCRLYRWGFLFFTDCSFGRAYSLFESFHLWFRRSSICFLPTFSKQNHTSYHEISYYFNSPHNHLYFLLGLRILPVAPAEPLPAPKVPDPLILLVPRKAGWTAKHWVRQLQNEKVQEQKRSIFLPVLNRIPQKMTVFSIGVCRK